MAFSPKLSEVTVIKFVNGEEITEIIKNPKLAKVKTKPKSTEFVLPPKETVKLKKRTVDEYMREMILSLLKLHDGGFLSKIKSKPELKLLKCKDVRLQKKFEKKKLRIFAKFV